MFLIFLILIIMVMASIIRRQAQRIATFRVEAATHVEQTEMLHWLHQATINRMNEARTQAENAGRKACKLDKENVRLIKLIMALEAAVSIEYVSSLN